MSLERKTVKAQVSRMESLDFFPQLPAGLKEVENALMEFPTAAMCESWVTDWLQGHEDFPKPAAIYASLRTVKNLQTETQEAWKNPPAEKYDCPHGCKGWGTIRNEAGAHQFCLCSAGQALREASPGWLELLGRLDARARKTPRSAKGGLSTKLEGLEGRYYEAKKGADG